MIKLCLKIWRIFLSVLTSRSRSLTSVLIWIMTSCFSCNIHNYRFFYNQCKLNVDNFNVESWTISFKLELLFAILPHSVFEFDLLFRFTNIYLQNWTEVSKIFDWLICLFWNEILRGGKFKLPTNFVAKTWQFWGNFPNFKHFTLHHINSFLESDLKKSF